MKTIKVGSVGLGLMGERHACGYDKMPLVELAAVCDVSETRAKAVSSRFGSACYTDFETMLKNEELDAVDIALPDNMHLGAVELAVKYNKHILLEKPMASTLSDAEKIYALTRDYNKTFMIGYILRFDPRYAGAKETVSSGRIGEGVSFYARRNSPIAGPLHYKGFTDLSMHVMVHDIDALQWIFNSRIVSVFAKGSNRVLKEYSMTDCIQALVTLENGVSGCIEACWILPEALAGSIDDKLEIIGTKGVIYTDSCDKGITVVDQKRMDEPDSRHWPALHGAVSGDLYEELTSFINCVCRGKPSIITSMDGLSAIKAVDAIERSVKTGSEITISYTH
jgi:UDP-N-acetylglucosamine 3-dehydrogenase